MTPLGIVVGVVGAVLWISLCQLQLEPRVLGPLDRSLGSILGMTGDDGATPSVGLVGSGERSAFNPLQKLASRPAWAYGFLAIRLIGLALIVPVIEEFFLRGFLMRFVVHDQWHQVPFGTVNRLALIIGTAIPMLMHPGELFAAAVWFSLVSWLMVRTRNIWDCVVAHAITNGALGAYVLAVNTPEAWRMM
jgi:CAAX prenyl protease-like protein